MNFGIIGRAPIKNGRRLERQSKEDIFPSGCSQRVPRGWCHCVRALPIHPRVCVRYRPPSPRRWSGRRGGGVWACGDVPHPSDPRSPASGVCVAVWCSRRGGVDDTQAHTPQETQRVTWMDGSMLIDDKMETKVFGVLMWVIRKRRKLSTLWLVSEGDFVCNQGVNISILRDRKTKRQKERKKRTHLFKQFHENTCFILTRIRGERTPTCVHDKHVQLTFMKEMPFALSVLKITQSCSFDTLTPQTHSQKALSNTA